MSRYWYVLALLLVMVLYGTASAMWLEELKIDVEVSTGDFDLKITSYKLLCEVCGCKGSVEIVDDGEGIQVVVDNVAPGSGVWIGLVLSNDGTLPLALTDVRVDGGTPAEVYVYGPFRSPGNSGVWGRVRVRDLPLPGDTGLPSPTCEPGYKLVVWIRFKAPNSESSSTRFVVTMKSILSMSS